MDTKLVGFKPSGEKFEIPLTEASTVLGRGEDCGIALPINSVSRKHCEFSLADGLVRIRDLGSANGTFVNNNRISEVRLSAGDMIVVGSLSLTLQIDGKPADISPAPAATPPPAEAPVVAPAETEDLAGGAVSLDEDDVAAVALGGGDDDGPISLADDSVADDPLAGLAGLAGGGAGGDAGGEALAADVFGENVDEEIDPISALEMLAADDEADDDPLSMDND